MENRRHARRNREPENSPCYGRQVAKQKLRAFGPDCEHIDGVASVLLHHDGNHCEGSSIKHKQCDGREQTGTPPTPLPRINYASHPLAPTGNSEWSMAAELIRQPTEVSTMNEEHSLMAAQSISEQSRRCYSNVEDHMTQPSVLYRPSLSIDGNQWCALYGADLQSGVAGFGDTPELAMIDFNKNWNTPLRNSPSGIALTAKSAA